MAYDLEIWFIRSILFIGIAPKLGPKLVMIRKMVRMLYRDFITNCTIAHVDKRSPIICAHHCCFHFWLRYYIKIYDCLSNI